jgi:hypothetical protein
MKKLLVFVVVLFWATTSTYAQTTPIDLRTWKEEGPPGNGTWNVSADGASVQQTINGNPTFFVGPGTYINTTIRGKLRVETTGDDDYIGFVFGYQSPIAANGDPETKFNFLLFDWKQTTQAFGGVTAQEGFSLARVNGTFINTDAGLLPGFWGHASSDTFQVLATSYGADKGWLDNIEYDFELVYQTNRIKISIDSVAIFDVAGDFPPGRFGFYNYSQASVRYQGFTQDPTPPPTPGCWEVDTFDNLALGSLHGQNGWTTVPGRSPAFVVPNPGGQGKVLRMDAPPNQTVIMSKNVNDQIFGIHTLDLRVRVDNPANKSLAKIEIRTTGNPNWDKKFQLYFGTSMRLDYGPVTPHVEFLSNVVSGRWYDVRAQIDLNTNLVDVYLDGVQTLNDIAVGPGPITELSVSAWDLPGLVYFDDINGCTNNASGPCGAASYFDADGEGWMVSGDVQSVAPDYFATGGNPGGFVSGNDLVTGGTWYWEAPAKFFGNQSCAYGQALTFDLKQSLRDNQFDGEDIVLEGGGLKLVYETPYNPDTSWTSYAVLLSESSGWRKNTLTGDPPTPTEFMSVLSALSGLRIRGEYRNGADSGGLDNVVLNGVSRGVGPLLYADHGIDDDAQGNSSGDGDGRAESGERLEMAVQLTNTGVQTATGIAAMLTSSDPDINIVANNNTWPDIAAGAAQSSAGSFDIAVNANLTEEKLASFTLTVTASNGGPWTSIFEVPVAPANRPPVVTSPIPDTTLQVGALVAINLKTVYSDPDQDLSALRFSTSSSDTNKVKASIVADTTLTLTARVEGVATIIVSADDGRGGIVQDTFTIKIVGSTAVEETTNVLPTSFGLDQNYPNPFSREAKSPALSGGTLGTLIKYQLPQAGQVVMKVYNSLGHEVRTLVNKAQQAGHYAITWDGRDDRGDILPSGMYFYRLEAGAFVQTRRMTLLK